MNLLSPLFRSPAVEADLSDLATIQSMLDFESALARAESRAGIFPASAAASISAACHAEKFDLLTLAESAAQSGNLAIPLFKQLTALVAQSDPGSARHIHFGATSQDAIDTGRILQLRDALNLISADLDHLSDSLADLAKKHRSTLIVARTWMQHALPTTLGAKVAAWLDALDRDRTRLHETQTRCLVLQFGGAVGTLAALGPKAREVAKFLSAELNLPLPHLPFHSNRDRFAEIATTLGLLTGSLAKIVCDLALHSQTEIAELFEPSAEGRGASSTMPHKRNPIASAVVLSAATRVPHLVATMLSAMPQEDERGLGGWHAEWETLPQIVSLTAGALHHLAAIAPHLEADTIRMRQNLDLTRGLIYAEAVTMALADKIGRPTAHALLESACSLARAQQKNLREILSSDAKISSHLSSNDLDRLFDPKNYLGSAEPFVDEVLAAHHAHRATISAGSSK
jgi:3-carboxy-cis,cis-muconate cycloisomerase